MTNQTQMEAARKGIVTKELVQVAKEEGWSEQALMKLLASGRAVIPANINHRSLHPYGIGGGLRTKINVNLGVSGDCIDYSSEMEKVRMAEKFGAEAIMDLSNYGKTRDFRKKLIVTSPAMIGTVPVYDATDEYCLARRFPSLRLDGEKGTAYYESIPSENRHSCSMCGKMCAVSTMNRILEGSEVVQGEEKKDG